MQTIGFKNFRRFEDLKPLELSGITFFVGGNNAGKSTVVKAMMLMHENICRSMDYSSEQYPIFTLCSERGKEVHVGTFGRALHKPYPELREIEIESQINNFIFRYVISGDVEGERLNADIRLCEIQNKERTWTITADYNKGVVLFKYMESEIDKAIERYNVSAVEKTNESSESNDLQNMVAQIDKDLLLLRNAMESADEIKIALIENDIKNKELQKKALLSRKTLRKDDSIITEEIVFTTDAISKEPRLMLMLRNHFKQKIEEVRKARMKTTSSNTRAKQEALTKQYEKIIEWLEYTITILQTTTKRFDIYYIPSHAVAQKVFFSLESRNDYMSNVIGSFHSMNFVEGSSERLFVQYWMKEFNIGLDFKIKSIQGEAFTVTITDMKGYEVPLADLGMGSIQIILLLLKLATLIENGSFYPSLVIVEEPEQNIHPKLQSKLAELFESVHRKYRLRFLIETHSEYMIRKTQAMIATDAVQFENNPFRVYYFPENGTPYDMVYKHSGMFENKFDEGFFDEASKQQFSVIKKAREIQHV